MNGIVDQTILAVIGFEAAMPANATIPMPDETVYGLYGEGPERAGEAADSAAFGPRSRLLLTLLHSLTLLMLLVRFKVVIHLTLVLLKLVMWVNL